MQEVETLPDIMATMSDVSLQARSLYSSAKDAETLSDESMNDDVASPEDGTVPL